MPDRTCVGCSRKLSQEALLRVVRRGGEIAADPQRQGTGRGAWLCSAACAKRAVERRAFSRAFKTGALVISEGFFEAVEAALPERASGFGAVDPEERKN